MKPASFQFKGFTRHEQKKPQSAWFGAARQELRQNGIGASEIPILAGLSDFATLNDLYNRKVNGNMFTGNEATRIGTHFEKPFFEYLRKYHFEGLTLQRNTGIYLAANNAPHFTTPDGFVTSILHTKPDVLELKISGYFSKKKCDAAAAQCQYTMHLLGLDTAYICVLQGTKVDIIKVPHDEHEGERLVELARDFWNSHVLAGKSP
jgi:predicted phage-related endonuclease